MESRGYHQHCGLARALDRVGERWTLLIARELLLGPRRYSQLLDSLQGITTNLLAKRLKSMQAQGILEKLGSGPATRYRLSPLGASLEPAVMELARWGGNFMATVSDVDRRDLSWALLSLKRRYAGGLEFRVGINIEQRSFELLFEKDKLWVQEREAVDPHLRLTGSEDELFAMLFQSHWSKGLRLEQRGQALAQWCQAVQVTPPERQQF